jgi:hypothetical protein
VTQIAAMLLPSAARAQVEVEAVLEGSVLVGDSAMRSGTVVLHRVSDAQQGEIDSTRVTSEGRFSMRLPGLPNPVLNEIYFASVRHQGVMYFGTPITQAIDLDSAYVIQAWDTLLAPAEGMPISLGGRALFVDPQAEGWTVTDAFTLQNDSTRTLVARPGGMVWSYPLPATATEVITGEGDLATDVTYESGRVVVHGPLAPGERMFVVRYTLASLETSIPTPGTTTSFDILVREPAPPLDVAGLEAVASVELEGGGTYRRYSGDNVTSPSVDVALGEEVGPPPVQWIAVILAVILGVGGVMAIGRARGRAPPVTSPEGDARQELLLEVARLDEEYHRQPSPTDAATGDYRARRAELLRRLRRA